VQIQTFNFAAQVTITGTTGAAGKPTYGSVNVARNVDVSSPLIMQSLVTGEALPAVTLTTMSMNAGEL
jgi:type VI protein secretion system component Hcp